MLKYQRLLTVYMNGKNNETMIVSLSLPKSLVKAIDKLMEKYSETNRSAFVRRLLTEGIAVLERRGDGVGSH